MIRRQSERLLVVAGAHDREHRPEDLVGVDRHVLGHVVEERRADEEAVRQIVVAIGLFVAAAVAAVDDEFCTLLDPLADVALDALECRCRDQRAVVGLGVEAVADAQCVDLVDQLGAQPFCCLLPDRDGDTDRHTALACTAVACADQRVCGLVEIGVGHDDHVVLGAAEALLSLIHISEPTRQVR